jgi:hypothetical protein
MPERFMLDAALALSAGNKAYAGSSEGHDNIGFVVECHWAKDEDYYSFDFIENDHTKRDRCLTRQALNKLLDDYNIGAIRSVWKPL